jgi:hypothetical protein
VLLLFLAVVLPSLQRLNILLSLVVVAVGKVFLVRVTVVVVVLVVIAMLYLVKPQVEVDLTKHLSVLRLV